MRHGALQMVIHTLNGQTLILSQSVKILKGATIRKWDGHLEIKISAVLVVQVQNGYNDFIGMVEFGVVVFQGQ